CDPRASRLSRPEVRARIDRVRRKAMIVSVTRVTYAASAALATTKSTSQATNRRLLTLTALARREPPLRGHSGTLAQARLPGASGARRALEGLLPSRMGSHRCLRRESLGMWTLSALADVCQCLIDGWMGTPV